MFEEIIKKFRNSLIHDEEYELTEEEKERKSYFERNILNTKQFGDYIWAIKDDFNFDGLEDKICPYIVIGKVDDKLIACGLTKSPNYSHSFAINKDDEKNKAYVLYSFVKAIDYVSYRHSSLYFNKSLTLEEKKKLKGYLSSLGENIFYKDIGKTKSFNIDTKQDFNIGDVIVSYNGLTSLIIDITDDDKYLCINLESYDEKENRINFNNEKFDFYERFHLPKKQYRFLGTLPNNQLTVILNKYSDYLKKVIEYQKVKETNSLVRGTIIKRMNNYYYVNTVESKKAKLFLLELSNKEDSNALSFGDLYFRPNYQVTTEIDENDALSKIIRLSSEEEMEMVKKDKKSKSKTIKQDNKPSVKRNNLELKDGNIIEHKGYYNQKFLILGFYDNNIITISLDDFTNGKTTIVEFYEFDRNISISKNVTLADRFAIEENQGYLFGLFEDICDKKDNYGLRLNK